MSICQLGMHKSVKAHTNANVCQQTYDASCTLAEMRFSMHIAMNICMHCSCLARFGAAPYA